MTMPAVVVFGEALTDIVQGEPGQWRSYPGGAPWNVARALSRLGVSSAFAGAVSSDSLGEELHRQTEAAGLDMRFIQRVHADPLVAIVPSSHPPRYFFAGDADLHFDPEQLPAAGLSTPNCATSAASAWPASHWATGWWRSPGKPARPASRSATTLTGAT